MPNHSNPTLEEAHQPVYEKEMVTAATRANCSESTLLGATLA